MVRFPFQELSAVRRADKCAVADRHLAAHGDNLGASLHREALKSAVIDVHVVGLGGYRTSEVGIVDHEVGVASQLDGSLSGEQPKDFRRLR